MDHDESERLHKEIEKLKFHNRTLLALLGELLKGQMQKPTIHEAIVVHDLSKPELQAFTQLIRDYEGDVKAFEQQATAMGSKFTDLAVKGLLKAFMGSGMLAGKCKEILQAYGQN